MITIDKKTNKKKINTQECVCLCTNLTKGFSDVSTHELIVPCLCMKTSNGHLDPLITCTTNRELFSCWDCFLYLLAMVGNSCGGVYAIKGSSGTPRVCSPITEGSRLARATSGIKLGSLVVGTLSFTLATSSRSKVNSACNTLEIFALAGSACSGNHSRNATLDFA